MERAVVLIGVARSGLPELPAVPAALEAMRGWAVSQGIPDELVVELSDADGSPVRIADVFDAVSALAARLTIEQLVVFFCGHGVYNDGTDLWLLSGAPGNSSEAVNVAKTVRLATRGTIPYVVLVADACRSATTTVQLSELTGAAVFPSPAAAGRQNDVDQFVACRLEDVATQIASPDDPQHFHALYSEVLAEALEGDHTEILEVVQEPDGPCQVLRAHALKQALPGLVALRVDELGKSATVNQVPVATVTSGPTRWVARLPLPEGVDARRGSGVDAEWVGSLPDVPDPAQDAAAAASRRLVEGWQGDRLALRADHPAAAAVLVVVGAEPVQAHCPAGPAQLGDGRVVVRPDDPRPAPVLLELAGGRCTVIPAVPGTTSLLTFEDGVLVDVRQGTREDPLEEDLRVRRSEIAAATRYGLPWWTTGSPGELLESRPREVFTDLGFLLYLAYGMDAAGDEEGLRRLLPPGDERLVPFDLALLAGSAHRRRTVPAWPLLTRGWALLGPDGLADRPDLPPRVTSPWTVFTQGFGELRDHLDAHG